MRKVLTAVAAGALAVTLSAPTAYAAPAADRAPQAQSQHIRHHDDGGDDDYYHDECRGIVSRLLCWLV
jgi:Spy/CpxP family protein refolding chaperone